METTNRSVGAKKTSRWYEFNPVCRAEYRSFRREQARQGRGRKPRVARGPWTALLATPGESEERRKQAATGSPFLWILSFGEAKESISPSGARPRFK
ncbi:hypothetical protein [Methylobacter sp.]|uniref:hypothetical protein n=1 Tax=Methylobacter sp. TaxID=2051955 RepID=UPI0025E79EE9|nr:hypothetical protein [Methylobacter sp.]